MPVIAQLLGGSQVSVPKTHDQLMGLIAQRDELRNQLETMNDQRAQLADQVARQSSGVPGNLVGRLNALDKRIGETEANLVRADEYIAAAKAKGLDHQGVTTTAPEVKVNVPVDEMVPEFVFGTREPPWQERFAQTAAITVPLAAGTVILLGALLYWRISRSIRNQLSKLMAAQSGRLEELQRSIDTVAVEVERVSENQRFVTKLVGDKSPAPVVERR